MNTTTIVIIGFFALGVIAAIVLAIWSYTTRRRTEQLRSKFGPEYKRTLRTDGDPRHAEQVLRERQQRVAKLDIKPLTDKQRDDFARAWEREQAHFVDNPTAAVSNADQLVKEVMKIRGYPMTDFEQRVADVSVDHPAVVQNYRLAHDIAVRHKHEEVGMEKLREAMIHYRALFADLLHDGGLQPVRQVVPAERERIRRVG